MKSRLISASLVLVMLLTLLPAAVMAEGAADQTPTITIEKTTAGCTAGAEVKVNVTITNNPGIVTMTIPIVWDENILELVDVIVPDPEKFGLSQLPAMLENTVCSGWIGSEDYDTANERGVYYLAWDNDLAGKNFEENGVLCTMVFEVIEDQEANTFVDIQAVMDGSNVGEKILLPIANVMNFDMIDLNGSGTDIENGGAELKPAPAGVTISGTVTSYGDGNATVELLDEDGNKIDDFEVTAGTYEFTDVAPGDYIIRVSKTNHVPREYKIRVEGKQ